MYIKTENYKIINIRKLLQIYIVKDIKKSKLGKLRMEKFYIGQKLNLKSVLDK